MVKTVLFIFLVLILILVVVLAVQMFNQQETWPIINIKIRTVHLWFLSILSLTLLNFISK